METIDNTMYFDTDDEFTSFCLCDNPTFYNKTIDGVVYTAYDYDYTDNYNSAIENSIMFKINEPNSKVVKHNCVNKGLITKPVKNLLID